MNTASESFDELQSCIDQANAPDASKLIGMLDGLRMHFQLQETETKHLSEFQAEALVHSAEIIGELEETKENLELSRLEAEAATHQAKLLSAFGDILENSCNEIFLFDAKTLKFVHVNQGAIDNIGYSSIELSQMTPLDIKPGQTPSSFAMIIEPLLKGTQSNIEFTTFHRRKDGSDYPVQVNLELSKLGNRPVFAAIILDITDRQKIEKELIASRQKALESDRSKSDFLANMSHEIRTPMTAILGFSDLLLDTDVGEAEKQNAAETIRRNGRHLLELINQILDLSKVESGKLEIEKQQIHTMDILKDVKELLDDRARAKGNQLQLEVKNSIPQTIVSDPTRLKQGLVNLAGNAIKFTTNGIVKIVAEHTPSSEQIQFHVVDSGIGITKEQIKRIFQPFGQADTSTTRKFGGTGLGLTITKQITQLLGGGVSVESVPCKGSTFTLTIATGPIDNVPMITSIQSPTTIQKTSSTSSQQIATIDGRVLLVEDGPDNQRLIAFVLKKAGADVTIAENGKLGAEAALEALDSGDPFGVILMDMQMPVMDGYEATRLLRQRGYSGQILALTAHAMNGESNKCLEAGCDAYLSKPIDRAGLIAEVAGRMGQSSILACK